MNKQKFRTIFVYILSIFFTLQLSALSYPHIITVDSVSDIWQHIEPKLHKNCLGKRLAFFDLDDTVFIPNDAILQNRYEKAYSAFIASFKELEDSEEYQGEIFKKMTYRLVQPEILNLMQKLKVNGFKNHGLTARSVGAIAGGTLAEDFAHKHLTQLGVVFDRDIVDEDIRTLRHGIAFCGKCPDAKGTTIKILLQKMKKCPDLIIMIEDRIHHLLCVKEAISQHNKVYNQTISFLGFHYTAVQAMEETLDEGIVDIQKAILFKKKCYVPQKYIENLLSYHLR